MADARGARPNVPSARSGPHTPAILSRHPLDGADLELDEDVQQIRENDNDDEDNEPQAHDDNDGPNISSDDPDFGDGPKLVEMPAWKKFLFSKWGCAVILSILTIIILLFVRPAFFLKRRENTLDKPRINWLVVFITWVVLFLTIAFVPMLITFCRKKWVGKSDKPGPRGS